MRLKEIKKEIKAIDKAYTIKTKYHHTFNLRVLEVLKDGISVYGGGANVYGKQQIDNNRPLFELMRANKNMVYDKDSIRVVF